MSAVDRPSRRDVIASVARVGLSAAVLFGVGWEIGREASLGTAERIAMAIGAGAFGVMMAVLKALLH